MIELKNDELIISFPALAEELHAIFVKESEDALSRILSEDRDAAARAYLATVPHPGPSRKAAIRDRIRELSRGSIREAFEEAVAVRRDGQTDGRTAGLVPGRVECRIAFRRTLRLPDDGKTYPLPPGLGLFPLRHLDDHAGAVPHVWLERGGVLMPMYQSEALWLGFRGTYPMAIKVAAGKINAVTGESWREGLHHEPQDHLVSPGQPWLDGFATARGVVRQFVATPLGGGMSVEEQVTGSAGFGGIQIQAYPMKAGFHFERSLRQLIPASLSELLPDLVGDLGRGFTLHEDGGDCLSLMDSRSGPGMGLGMGGRMRQEIYRNPVGPGAWDFGTTSRCFVHLCNALDWRRITGGNPPQTPVTAADYSRAGLPWFDFYRDDLAVLEGSKILAGLKGLAEFAGTGGAGECSVSVPVVVSLGAKPRHEHVREWSV